MNSFLEKEKMEGKVQMIFIDPPYGIKFNSNFQPFTNKRDVKDKDDASIPAEPEMIKAFRDTWELGVHSYLTSLRDRLFLAKELLHETGSVFVQISDENVHLVRNILDEVFTPGNFICQIGFRTSMTKPTTVLNNVFDYVLWYSKDKSNYKFRELFQPRDYEDENEIIGTQQIEASSLQSKYEFEYLGTKYNPRNGWRVGKEGLQRLAEAGRLHKSGSLRFIRYAKDFPYVQLDNIWTSQMSEQNKIYVVQTNTDVVKRCLLMTTDPGDLVLDITCGSGTTAFVAEQWGRRWITCETSRVSIQLAKQRLMTAKFDYYELAQLQEGVSSGFRYKTSQHIMLGNIANNEPAKEETLYDQPLKDTKKVRVTGPFTVESVPGVRVKPIDGKLPDVSDKTSPTNLVSEKLNDYMDNIRTSGIRSYQNDGITFNIVEVAEGFKEIHAFGSIDKNGENKRCAIIFGPDYAQMEQTQIERTMDEIRSMEEKPEMVIFCSYAFDPEASKDIDNIKISGLQILKAQMNTDLLTKDLKKNANTNKPFWLVGEPDIEVIQSRDGKYQVEVKGFDCYDPSTQELKSCGIEKIAVWMLDTDYDNRSLFPSQVFFPMQDEKRDWTKLAKALNVKIVDDRGVEMLIVKKI